MKTFNDETGKTYGRLTVLERHDPEKHGEFYCSSSSVLWYCRCKCGEYTIVTGSNLRAGATRSCGCLRREVTSARRRRKE